LGAERRNRSRRTVQTGIAKLGAMSCRRKRSD
jgi:hypothetical protein